MSTCIIRNRPINDIELEEKESMCCLADGHTGQMDSIAA